MKVAVWDTYVTDRDGELMHFDILVPSELKEEETIYAFGRDYLQSKNKEGAELAARECRFCHIEQATTDVENSILEKGYYIIEMEGCD